MRIAALTLLLGTLCLAACDDSSDIILVPISRTGTFILRTANNQILPATIIDSVSPPLRIDVLSGSFSINSDNTFSERAALRQSLGGIVTSRTLACAGTYVVTGNTFTFAEAGPTPDCGHTFSGVLVGTTLRTFILGSPAVYIR